MATTAWQELRLLGVLEILEFLSGATQSHLTRSGVVHAAEKDKTTEALPVPRLHDQMGDSHSDRVDYHASHFATQPIGTTHFRPDRKLRCIRHQTFLAYWTSVSALPSARSLCASYWTGLR